MASGVRAGGLEVPPPVPRTLHHKKRLPETNFPEPWRNGGGRDDLQPALHRTLDLDHRVGVLGSNGTVLCARGGTPGNPTPSGIARSGHLPDLPRLGSVPAMGPRT